MFKKIFDNYTDKRAAKLVKIVNDLCYEKRQTDLDDVFNSKEYDLYSKKFNNKK